MGKILQKNSLQLVKSKEDTKTPAKVNIFPRDIKYLKVKDVKRAYSKLIQDFCKGIITNEDAKTLVYMFSSYLQLIRDVEFEARITDIESRLGE